MVFHGSFLFGFAANRELVGAVEGRLADHLRTTLRERAALAAVIVLGVALAAVWMVRLPLLQGNDENAHADYVFALYDAGRPYRVERTASGANLSPHLRYLEDATRFDGVRYLVHARAVSGYGSARFVAAVDARAPAPTHALPSPETRAPFAAYAYPAGYYALAAIVMTGVRAATHSFVDAYVATRSLSLVFLAASLALSYRLLRMQRLGHGLALTLVAAIGVLPMTSWVSSYVQPDNLTFTLVTLALVCAVAWREAPFALGRSIALGAAVGALAFVKLHYALAIALACAPLVASRLPHRGERRRAALLALCAIPACAAAAARYATPAGTLRPLLDASNANGAAHAGALAHAAAFAGYVAAAAIDAFVDGISFDRFWLAFGWNDTPFFAPPLLALVAPALALLSLAFAFAFVASRAVVFARLRTVARRDPRAAVALACGDVLVNAYLVWTAMLLAVYAGSNGTVALQGRYWLPVLVPTLFVSAISIRRIVPPRARRGLGIAIARTWLGYALAAMPFALLALQARYYGPEQSPPPANVAIVMHARDSGALVMRPTRLVAARGAILRLDGFAVSGGDGSPVRSVELVIDGVTAPAVYGARIFNANQIRPVGFVATLRTRGLAPGTHAVALRTTGPDGRTTTAPAFRLAITDAASVARRAP